MANMTFAIDLPAAQWTLIADGADYSAVGLQVASKTAIAIFIGESEPGEGETGFLILDDKDSKELAVDVPATQQVYGRGQSRNGSVRGYRVAVA